MRVRLAQTEVEALRRDGFVEAQTGFPGGRALRYEIESSPASVMPTASFSDGVVQIRLPETTVLAWATTEQVSIAGEQPLGDGETLRILVEKDFTCLVPREGEDDSDMYPHPEHDTTREPR